MTPELTADSPGEALKQVPSTAGMTTKVVKGSMWTLAGQVAPLLVSLFTTPFVIRMLGAEGYGVFILIGLIPTFLSFADFGMSMASTKFASEAYSEGDTGKEGRIIRTAVLIALASSIPIAIVVSIFATKLVAISNIPISHETEAILGIRIVSATFVVSILSTIVNSPQLARLRMGVNTFVNAGSRITGLIAMPIVVYAGYGILGAVSVLFVVSLLNLGGHLYFSSKAIRLFSSSIAGWLLARRMIWFGGSLVIASAAAMVVANVEKIVLPSSVSVEALAYYSVAFTLASMVALFSQAMVQSLIPAFSQLQGSRHREQLNNLYLRGLRLNLILLIPTITILVVVAKPFFFIWAGAAYAEHSLSPFYLLLIGLLFNLPAFLPSAVIMATGRSDVFAKLYLIELIPYIFLVLFLTNKFGISGAALAWAVRMAGDSTLQFVLARRFGGIRHDSLPILKIIIGASMMISPIVATYYFGWSSSITLIILFESLIMYAAYAFKRLLDEAEVNWITRRLTRSFSL